MHSVRFQLQQQKYDCRYSNSKTAKELCFKQLFTTQYEVPPIIPKILFNIYVHDSKYTVSKQEPKIYVNYHHMIKKCVLFMTF